MQKGIQRGGLNPNKGLNTKKFLMIVGAFLVLALVAIMVWTAHAGHKGGPDMQTHTKSGDGNTATEKGGGIR